MGEVDGQLDVFEVLDLIAEEGLVPGKQPDEDETMKRIFLHGLDTNMSVMRRVDYSYWVVDTDGNPMHELPFWSQIECWAFIVGWETANL